MWCRSSRAKLISSRVPPAENEFQVRAGGSLTQSGSFTLLMVGPFAVLPCPTHRRNAPFPWPRSILLERWTNASRDSIRLAVV